MNKVENIRIQKSGCLDFCENGIACVVYPEGTWYRLSPDIDVKSLIENLKNDTIDETCLCALTNNLDQSLTGRVAPILDT